MLPDGDGADLLEQIRDEGLPIRVAVTTGSADARRLRAVADLRPEAILTKPIHLPDLLRALDVP
jgi:CheY-like chemotaxis protein